MSLATRCTACGTAFRVIQDQLQVSEGWVRCGRCSQVFNALEGLFDLERDAAGEAPVAAMTPASAPSPESALAVPEADAGAGGHDIEPDASIDGTEPEREVGDPSGSDALEHDADAPAGSGVDAGRIGREGIRDAGGDPLLHAGRDLHDVDEEAPLDAARLLLRPAVTDSSTMEPHVLEDASALDAEIDAHLFGGRRAARRRPPSPGLDERDRLDFSDARFDSDLLADAADDEVEPIESALDATPTDFPLETSTAPDFVRRAERAARWQRPRVRATLGLAGLLLAATLALQAAHHFRDVAAARWPAARSALAGWCSLLSCTLEAPRRIDDVSVESTALARVPGLDAFRLALTVKSRSPIAVAMPWVDLTLTDSAGKLVARKALAANQFEPTTSVLQPGAEVALQALLDTGAARITGYTVEIFYP